MLFKGTGVSAGIAQGTAFVVACGFRSVVPRRTIGASGIAAERRRFEAALRRAQAELIALQKDVRENIGASQADIFVAQGLILDDASLRARVVRTIEEKLVGVETALLEVFEEYTRALERGSDGILRARAADLHDVRRRVIAALAEERGEPGPAIPVGAIVVSDELLPSATARLELDHAGGFVTERGNRF
jgi:phosphotransferase system enzyme I (PtsI)